MINRNLRINGTGRKCDSNLKARLLDSYDMTWHACMAKTPWYVCMYVWVKSLCDRHIATTVDGDAYIRARLSCRIDTE